MKIFLILLISKIFGKASIEGIFGMNFLCSLLSKFLLIFLK
ncbi:hypothetical protein X929_09600 [Petrotoga olearia DSM 13574]|uniref:Uncharacterized protein n=1 Tax=Petrotoga olearia DSM 13574 TaxID=1122955 RepID=A0A2K1NXB3_9BACT|nr:hypothetical protein X929_09600 [Petrotoga olearia DSM 13574]